MIATSAFLTALECTEFVFGRGSTEDPTGGAYSAPSDAPAGLRGPYVRGRGWRVEMERRMGEKGKWGDRPPFRKFLDPPLVVEAVDVTCVLQIINLGVLFHPGSYCRDLWNILDATVVICALVAFFFT